jgi:pimeloyl-ACP methyl ester carboxylesterase
VAKPRGDSFRWKYILPGRKFVVRVAGNLMWAVSPRITLWFIKLMFKVPGYPAPKNAPADFLQTGRRFELAVLGRRVVGWRWGEGPLALLVHGWGERGIRFHNFVPALVARGFSVVTFDFPGHGESEGRRTNFIEIVSALKAVVEHAGKPAAVVGYSMGGGATVSLWEMFDADTRIVLISPLYDIFHLFTDLFDKVGFSPRLLESILKEVEKEYRISWSSINPSENAHNVKGATLVVHYEDDFMVSMAHAEELASKMPNARLYRTAGLGHFRMMDSAEVMEQTLAFIKKGG